MRYAADPAVGGKLLPSSICSGTGKGDQPNQANGPGASSLLRSRIILLTERPDATTKPKAATSRRIFGAEWRNERPKHMAAMIPKSVASLNQRRGVGGLSSGSITRV